MYNDRTNRTRAEICVQHFAGKIVGKTHLVSLNRDGGILLKLSFQ